MIPVQPDILARPSWPVPAKLSGTCNQKNFRAQCCFLFEKVRGKCGANLVSSILHVVAKMFFTNVEALGDA